VHLGQGELSRLGTRSDQMRVRLRGVRRIKPFAVVSAVAWTRTGRGRFVSEFCCMLIRSGRSNKICGFHWRGHHFCVIQVGEFLILSAKCAAFFSFSDDSFVGGVMENNALESHYNYGECDDQWIRGRKDTVMD
jgi:hypothetical protein